MRKNVSIPLEKRREMQMQMNKDFIGKAALKLLEKNAKRNANKLCRNFIYEPTVPKKLKNK